MSNAPACGPQSTREMWDSLTPCEMHRRGSLKWTQSPFSSLTFWPFSDAANDGSSSASSTQVATGVDYQAAPVGAWVAEMDLGTAPSVAEAIERAVRDGNLGYMPQHLASRARKAAAGFITNQLHWSVSNADVSLLPNVLSALSAVIAHHTRAGSAVIVPTPAYMPFLSIPAQEGRACVEVPSQLGPDGWHLDLEGIESAMADGAGLLILCNPWNPVGRVLRTQELDAIAELSARYGTIVFSDEIHSPLVIDPNARFVSYASRPGADPDLTYTAMAASKGWNIPGLHCAFLIARGGARRAWQACDRTAALAHMAAPLGAAAALAAFEDGLEWNAQVRTYVWEHAQRLAAALQQVCPQDSPIMRVPEGTYLAWLDLSALSEQDDHESAALRLARDYGLHTNPGGAFGRGYEHYARLNMATGRSIIDLMIERLTAALQRK